ncbi:hypothetical protein GS506_21135 [Rhodococcus hoagii]|nr:hypothetical protein [Prescottella equi]
MVDPADPPTAQIGPARNGWGGTSVGKQPEPTTAPTGRRGRCVECD